MVKISLVCPSAHAAACCRMRLTMAASPFCRHHYDSGAHEGIGFYAEERFKCLGQAVSEAQSIWRRPGRLPAVAVDSAAAAQVASFMSSATSLPGTLPYSWYSDPKVLAREHEQIFRRRWQYVGHSGQVPRPGCLSPSRAGDVPVLLVRDHAGEIRAYANVCRHRGARLVARDAERATIQCPYHAWTYGLDGCLRSAPRSHGEAGFEADGRAARSRSTADLIAVPRLQIRGRPTRA